MKYLSGVLAGIAIGLAVAILVLRPDAVPSKPCNGPALSALEPGQLQVNHVYTLCNDGKDWRFQEIKP